MTKIDFLKQLLEHFNPPFLPDGFVKLREPDEEIDTWNVQIGDRDVSFLIDDDGKVEFTGAGTAVGDGTEWDVIPLELLAKKPMGNTNMEEATAGTPDIQIHENPGAWKCLCKASSESQGWMKSTKALEVPGGCVLQVTTKEGDQIR